MSIVVHVHPRAGNRRIAVWAPHRSVAVFFNIANHLLPCGKATFQDLSRLIDLIPPEMTDVFMARAARHSTRCAFYDRSHFDHLLGLLAACVSADAATLFCAGVDLGFDRILLAFDATDGDVRSLRVFDVAIRPPHRWLQ